MSSHYRSTITAGLTALTALLFTAACASNNTPAAVTALSSHSAPTSAVPTTSVPATTSPTSAGLPGWFYYLNPSDQIIQVHNGHSATVLPHYGYVATVSPDGKHIATIDGTGTLVVTDRNGDNAQPLTTGLVDAGYEPAWSPDSTKVLVGRNGGGSGGVVPGVVNIAGGAFTPLAHDPGGIHYLWSADGNHLAYATGVCQIGIADSDGGNAHLIPVLGNTDHTVNPNDSRSCDPYSVSPDASRIAVDLHTGDRPDGDIGRNLDANAIIDTSTGHPVTVPVSGTLTAAFYLTDGSLLLRTVHNHVTTLTLLGPDNSVAGRITEPSKYGSDQLLAYIPS